MRHLLLTLALACAVPALALAQDAPKPDDKKPAKLTEEELDKVYYLIEELGSRRWNAREKAMKALIAMGPKVASTIVEELKEVEQAEVAWRLRKVLVGIGMAHLDAKALEGSLKDLLDPLSAQGLLYWYVKRSDEPMPRGNGAKVFAELKKTLDPKLHTALFRAMGDERAALRVNLAYFLGQLGDAKAAPYLAKALSDDNPLVRQHAAFAIGVLRAEKQIPAVAKLVREDKDQNVRMAAAAGLARMRKRAAVKALIDLLPGEGEARPQDMEVASQVKHHLRRLTDHRTRYNPFNERRRKQGLQQWKDWWSANGKTFEFAASATAQPRRSATAQIVELEVEVARANAKLQALKAAKEAAAKKAAKKPEKAAKKPEKADEKKKADEQKQQQQEKK